MRGAPAAAFLSGRHAGGAPGGPEKPTVARGPRGVSPETQCT